MFHHALEVTMIITRRSVAPLGLAAAILLAASSGAAAQGPPPPGTPPPGGPPPGALPPPPEVETPAEDPEAPPPPAESPPVAEAPQAGAELAADSVHLRGRRISVPLRCGASGRITLRHKGTRLARAEFACDDGVAVAALRVRPRAARRLKQKPRRRVHVEMEVAGSRFEDDLVLRTRTRRATASASSAIAGTGVAQCGSRHSYGAPGFSIVPPAFFTQTAASDWKWYRLWRYWHGRGWERVKAGEDPADLRAGWEGPYFAPPKNQGATYISRYTIDFLDDYRGWYVAAGFEVYSASTGRSEFRWAPMAEVMGGFPVLHGSWCAVP